MRIREKTRHPKKPAPARPENANPKIDLDRQVGFLLRRAFQRNMAIWKSYCVDRQLTAVQVAVLVALYNNRLCSLTEMGRTAGMAPATSRSVAERIAEKKLISFIDNLADRHKLILHLEDAGRRLFVRTVLVFRQIT